MYIVVGLGNPSSPYINTRHNTGRMAAEEVRKFGSSKLKVLIPDTFMNKTGSFVSKHVKSKKAAEKLIAIYDDLDLPLGVMKVSYNRSSGGHKGLESIIRALKTKAFIRIRIGIGQKKKPDVEKYILGNFTPRERDLLKKVFKRVCGAVETIVQEGREIAMNQFN